MSVQSFDELASILDPDEWETIKNLPEKALVKRGYPLDAEIIEITQRMYLWSPTKYSCAGHPKKVFGRLNAQIVVEYNPLFKEVVNRYFEKLETTPFYQVTLFSAITEVIPYEYKENTFALQIVFRKFRGGSWDVGIHIRWADDPIYKKSPADSNVVPRYKRPVPEETWRECREKGFERLFQMMRETTNEQYTSGNFEFLKKIGGKELSDGSWLCGDSLFEG